ncbi:MAG: amidohydrolase [Anaerolineales bacterium]
METLLLNNARIYTMDPRQPQASALEIRGGKIERVLTEPGADRPGGSGKTLDLNGRVLLPGLIDSHLHLRHYAETLQKINYETDTKEECLHRVADRAAETTPGEWILGHGWNHNTWAGEYGTALDLDQIAPNNPVYLTGKSLHVSWANTAAIIAAGIGEGTQNPAEGTIQRDEYGHPTGILFEKAVKLIEDIIPKPSLEKTAQNLLVAQNTLWKMGLTGVHDFDRELCIQALLYLDNRDQLRLRTLKSIPREFLEEAIELGYHTGKGSDWLWFGGVKLFADGALGSKTAAMLAPYEGSENNQGMLMLSEEELVSLGSKAAAAGLSLSVHAIGDLANRNVLNALEKIRKLEKEQGYIPLPHRIEHLQLLDPADVPRLAELGITASMQPIHATSDMAMADLYWGKRAAFGYAPKLQLESGARVIFGSDAPVESPNPFWGIHAAVTRRNADGAPGPEGWYPEGRLGIQHALEGYTVSPAAAAGKPGVQGQISQGSWADLIVLETDPFRCSEDELRDIKPVGTMVDSVWVWREF